MSIVNYELVFAKVTAWTSLPERKLLTRLAEEVPAGGTIVEIGGLYGGTTIVLGTANSMARITVLDNFSWSPLQGRPACKEELLRNTASFGLTNVTVLEGDSCETGRMWNVPIDFLWVDGGHTYEMASADLVNFGPHAQVIAVHDWTNTAWPGVRKAVEDFMAKHSGWEIAEVVEMVVVLRKAAPLASPQMPEKRRNLGGKDRK